MAQGVKRNKQPCKPPLKSVHSYLEIFGQTSLSLEINDAQEQEQRDPGCRDSETGGRRAEGSRDLPRARGELDRSLPMEVEVLRPGGGRHQAA